MDVWEVVFSPCSSPTWQTLHSWRWIWTLSRVCTSFSRALFPLRTAIVNRMCDKDRKETIWKKKAMEIFTLTDKDLKGIKFSIASSSYRREVHLMLRSSVLKVALAKHGGTFEGINKALLTRNARLDNLRTKRSAKKKQALEDRRTAVDAILIAEGIPRCGFLYEDVLAGREPMDLTEFRFRTHVHNECNREYEGIIDRLHDDEGYFYQGIHSDARDIIRRRLAKRGIHF